MSRRFEIGMVCTLLVASALRLSAVAQSRHRSHSDLDEVRARVTSVLRRSDPRLPSTNWNSLGITRVEFQRFDPAAVVVMQPGPDGQPGVARIDDDRNQVIDDRSELGATYSDDVCSVQLHVDQDEATLVLQYGAYVPVSPAGLNGENGQPMRAVVFGESPGKDRWSFLVEVKKAGSWERGAGSGELGAGSEE